MSLPQHRPRQEKRLGVLSRDGEPFFLVLEIGSRAVLPKGPGVKKKHVTKLSAMTPTSVPALRGAPFRLGSAPYQRSLSVGKCRDRAGRRRALVEVRIHPDPCRTSNGSRAAGTDASSLFPSLASGSVRRGQQGGENFFLTILFFLVALFCKRGGRERTAHVPSAAGNGSVIDACRPATRSRPTECRVLHPRQPPNLLSDEEGNWAITR